MFEGMKLEALPSDALWVTDRKLTAPGSRANRRGGMSIVLVVAVVFPAGCKQSGTRSH